MIFISISCDICEDHANDMIIAEGECIYDLGYGKIKMMTSNGLRSITETEYLFDIVGKRLFFQDNNKWKIIWQNQCTEIVQITLKIDQITYELPYHCCTYPCGQLKVYNNTVDVSSVTSGTSKYLIVECELKNYIYIFTRECNPLCDRTVRPVFLTSTGTYIVPSGVIAILVNVIGAGGMGGQGAGSGGGGGG